MYCLTVSYPKGEDTTFDHEYYRDTHIPLCQRLFGEHGLRGTVLRTAEGKAPGSDDLNHATIDLIFDSSEGLQAALAAGGKEVSADLVNYTNAKPRMSFCEITVDL
ncbi:MAG: EthD family reductase [Gammaproteobacteria bacterium]|nr:EthD family reductase [Gammaproteobacteria bacterium]